MNDYLENLAIRNTTAGRDALVQPRLPAMYESLSASLDSAGEAPLSVPSEREPPPAASELRATIRPGNDQGTSPNLHAEFQPPGSLPVEGERTVTEAKPQQVPMQPLETRTAPPAPIAPSADDTPRASSRHESAQPPAEATVQHPLDWTGLDESAVEPHPGAIAQPREERPRHQPRQAPADPAGEYPIDLTGPDEPGSEGTPKAPGITRLNEEIPHHEPARAPADPAAVQRLTNMAKPDESGSEGMAQAQRHAIIQPNKERHLNSTERIQIARETSEPRTSPMVIPETPDQKLSSQGNIASENRSRLEVPETAGNEKQAVHESLPAFPSPAARTSLLLQGPVPTFAPPPRRRPRNDDAPAAGMTGGDQPPVVRVSIGRVEVRAILPAAPAEKRSPPGPPMSLDEYLKRQNEANR